MTFLYIILAIISVLILSVICLLFSPLSVRIVYSEGIEVYGSVSFIRIKLFPKKKKINDKTKKSKKEKKTSDKNNQVSSFDTHDKTSKVSEVSEDKENSTLKDSLSLILDIMKSFFDMVGKRGKIRIDKLRVVVSRPDAADTAILFGICGGIVSTILAFTSNFGKAVIKDKNISIAPDFVSGKSSIETDITLSARVVSILACLVSGYLKNVKRKSTGRTDKK